MNRLEYANINRQRYLDWADSIANTPCTAGALLEFAVISAHTPMSVAIAGWRAVQEYVVVSDVANALYRAGVIAPFNKAARICQIRDDQPMPSYPFAEYRRQEKLPGLGICKLSFGCCLIAPLDSDIVCLDTHILQTYLERQPTQREVNRIYTRLPLYEYIENKLTSEAAEIGLPSFPYQWAVWDWKRARIDHKPPLNHSFLWQNPSDYQLPLFSSQS